MKSPLALLTGAVLLFATLSACGGGGNADGPAPALLELSPVSGGATTDDSIRVEGRTSQPVSAVVVGGQSTLVDPLTQRFSVVVPLLPGRNVLDVDLVLPDGRFFGDVGGLEVLRTAGPQALIESLAVSPGGERLYFVEDTGDRWLTEVVVATGARQRLANFGPLAPSFAPVAVHWDATNARLLFGTDILESYDPLSGLISPVGATPVPNIPLLDWSPGATPQSGFALVGLSNVTRVHSFDFGANLLDPLPLSSSFPSQRVTTIDFDASQNRLLSAGTAIGDAALRIFAFDLATASWSEIFNLGATPVSILRRAAVVFAPAQRRLVVAYDTVSDEGQSTGITLRSIDVDSGTEVTRALPRDPAHLPSIRPGLDFDSQTGRLHLAFGRRFLALDPLNLNTLATAGRLAPALSGVADLPLNGPVRLDPHREEILQSARADDGSSTLVSSNLVGRERRRVATMPPGFVLRLVNVDPDGDVAWGYLRSDSGAGPRPIARIDLSSGSTADVELLANLPMPGGLPTAALAIHTVPATQRLRIFTESERLFELGADGITWTELPLPPLPMDVRWTPSRDGLMLGLYLEAAPGAAQGLSALRLDLNAATITATGSTVFTPPSGPLNILDTPQRIIGTTQLAQRFEDAGGRSFLLSYDVESNVVAVVLDAAQDGFGVLGNLAPSASQVDPQLALGTRPGTLLISFRARVEQAGTSLAEVDATRGTTLLLHR
jgi:hypothetical protein